MVLFLFDFVPRHNPVHPVTSTPLIIVASIYHHRSRDFNTFYMTTDRQTARRHEVLDGIGERTWSTLTSIGVRADARGGEDASGCRGSSDVTGTTVEGAGPFRIDERRDAGGGDVDDERNEPPFATPTSTSRDGVFRPASTSSRGKHCAPGSETRDSICVFHR